MKGVRASLTARPRVALPRPRQPVRIVPANDVLPWPRHDDQAVGGIVWRLRRERLQEVARRNAWHVHRVAAAARRGRRTGVAA